MTEYTAGSMFAGIGGMCKACQLEEIKMVWANEIDEHASKTYIENFGNSYLVTDDIRNIKDVPYFDILTSGFPCQSFSIAGTRKGFKDDRGLMFFETMRISNLVKPKAVLFENVKGLQSIDNGDVLDVINTEIKKSYYLWTGVLNTLEYSDLPQNRERLFFVGFRDMNAFQSFQRPLPDYRNKSLALKDIIDFENMPDEKYNYDRFPKYKKMVLDAKKNENRIYQIRRHFARESTKSVVPTLTANMGTGGHNVPLIILNNGQVRKLTPRECFALQGYADIKIPENMSDNKLYKQAGNSVSVPVVQLLIRKIKGALEKTS